MSNPLFKAKTHKGEWVFGYYYEQGDKAYILQDGKAYEVRKETRCQFTGKTDKNKKEIYGEDILKDQDDVIYEVWYCEQTAAFMAEMINPANDMVDILGAYDTDRMFEVIGNKFDK